MSMELWAPTARALTALSGDILSENSFLKRPLEVPRHEATRLAPRRG